MINDKLFTILINLIFVINVSTHFNSTKTKINKFHDYVNQYVPLG